MIEPVVTATVAAIAGGYAILQNVHRRVTELDTKLDQRMDRIELTIARDYISREEYAANQIKLEEHMVRIEKKLDIFIQEFSRR